MYSDFSQQAPPQGINYQAVVYSSTGNQQVGVNSAGQQLLNTHPVKVTFTITDGNQGPEIFKEEHDNINTDQYGLVNVIIGQGTQLSTSAFNQINWSSGDKYLRVNIYIYPDSPVQSFTVSSYQKLWSVPYALYADEANSADYATNSGYADSSDFAEMAGNGITGVSDNGNGTLTFTYYDGSTYTTGVLSGLMGQQGPAGANGQSAYDLWLAQGNTGTQQDFLSSLQGATGPQGPPGLVGSTGPQGPTGLTGPQGQSGLVGSTGPQGPIGLAGATGPQGPIGLTGLTGAQGPTGLIGITGAAGTNGKNTLVKTTTETVGVNCATGGVKLEYGLDANSNSVVDAGEINAALTKYVCNGATGSQGPTGPTGSTGPQGIQGIQGPTGTPGSQNAWSLTGNAGTNPTTNFIGTTDAQDWAVKTNNLERMRVTAAGNIGIGTNNPNFNLLGNTTHLGQVITNNLGTAALQLESYRNTSNHSKIAAFNYRGTSGTPQNLQDGDELLQIGGYGYNGPNDAFYGLGCRIIFGVDGTPSLNSTPGFLDFRTRKLGDVSDLSRMFINSDGNVGVGTQNPGSQFTISEKDNSGLVETFAITDELNFKRFSMRVEGTSDTLFSNVRFDIYPKANNAQAQFRFFLQTNTTGPKTVRFYRGDGTFVPSAVIGVDGQNSYFQNHGGNFGIGTANPARTLHVNAVMRLEPIATAPTSPAKGDMYFDSTINKLRVYDGTVWQNCW